MVLEWPHGRNLLFAVINLLVHLGVSSLLLADLLRAGDPCMCWLLCFNSICKQCHQSLPELLLWYRLHEQRAGSNVGGWREALLCRAAHLACLWSSALLTSGAGTAGICHPLLPCQPGKQFLWESERKKVQSGVSYQQLCRLFSFMWLCSFF